MISLQRAREQERRERRGGRRGGEEGEEVRMNIMRKFLGGSQGGGQPPGRAQEYHPEQVGRRVARHFLRGKWSPTIRSGLQSPPWYKWS